MYYSVQGGPCKIFLTSGLTGSGDTLSLAGKKPCYREDPLFLRDTATTTLDGLRTELDRQDRQRSNCSTAQIALDLPNHVITFPREGDASAGNQSLVEVPATPSGIQAIGDYCQVPTAFLKRLDPDLQQHLLSTLLTRADAQVSLEWQPGGVVDVMPVQREVVPPLALIDVAENVIGPDARVVEWWKTRGEFRFDVIVPEVTNFGRGGDPRVDDITDGGLRFGQDLKHNLAPWVQPYLYRLICTNGMESFDPGLRVDARGKIGRAHV